jgi:hypothetical protein
MAVGPMIAMRIATPICGLLAIAIFCVVMALI